MPCPHNEITIVQRSQRQSAVAAAAYQSGEKLFCEYDQQVKHYPEKRGIVHNEILLPANAPRSYADRNTLWNAAEVVEKQWNSQLARRWVLTIPREIPPDQYAVLVREFCEQLFAALVSSGGNRRLPLAALNNRDFVVWAGHFVSLLSVIGGWGGVLPPHFGRKKAGDLFQISCLVCRFVGGGYLVVRVWGYFLTSFVISVVSNCTR